MSCRMVATSGNAFSISKSSPILRLICKSNTPDVSASARRASTGCRRIPLMTTLWYVQTVAQALTRWAWKGHFRSIFGVSRETPKSSISGGGGPRGLLIKGRLTFLSPPPPYVTRSASGPLFSGFFPFWTILQQPKTTFLPPTNCQLPNTGIRGSETGFFSTFSGFRVFSGFRGFFHIFDRG